MQDASNFDPVRYSFVEDDIVSEYVAADVGIDIRSCATAHRVTRKAPECRVEAVGKSIGHGDVVVRYVSPNIRKISARRGPSP